MSEKDFTLDEIMKELHKDALLSEPSDTDPYELERVLNEVRGYQSPMSERQATQTPQIKEEEAAGESAQPQQRPDPKQDEALPTNRSESEADAKPQEAANLTDLQKDYLMMKQNRQKRVQEFVRNQQESEDTQTAAAKVQVERTAEPSKPPVEEAQPPKAEPEETKEPAEESNTSEPPQEESQQAQKERSGLMEEDAEDSFGNEWMEEFTSKEQAPQIRQELRAQLGRMRGKTVLLAVCAVLSLIPAFCTEVIQNPPVDLLDAAVQPMFVLGYYFVLLLLATLGCFDFLSNGLIALLKRQPNAYSPYSLSVLVTVVVNVVLLAFPDQFRKESVNLFVPLLLFCLLSVPLGKTISLRRIQMNFERMVDLKDPYAVEFMISPQKAEEFTKKKTDGEPVLIYNKKTPFLSHFVDESFSEDVSDLLPLRMIPVSLVLALVCAAIVVLRQDGLFAAMTTFSVVLTLCAGMLPFFISNFPLFEAALRLQEKHAGVLGNNACETFEEGNAILLDAKDLFKGTDVTLYGIKTFLDGPPVDRVILDAASILTESNSILGDVFLNIIVNRRDYLSPVDDIKYEDGMGISAWVNDRRILIGSRELMIHHSVSVPDKDYEDNLASGERHLLYLSSSGQLSAIFVIGLDCNEEIRGLMDRLFDQHVLSVVKTVDPIITEEVLGHAFHLPKEVFRVIPSVLHKEAAEISVSERPANGGAFNDGTLLSFVQSFLTAKCLNRSIFVGSMIYYITVGLALLLVLLFSLMHGLSQMGNVMLCFYELLAFAVCLLVQHLMHRS